MIERFRIIIFLLIASIKDQNNNCDCGTYKIFLSSLMVYLSVKNYLFIDFGVKLRRISFGLGVRNFTIVLLSLLFWIFGLVFILIKEENLIVCINLNFIILLVLKLFFISIQLFSFYFFFEVSLIFIFLIIIKWGSGEKRIEASYFILFYTLFFSLFFLIFIFIIVKVLKLDLLVNLYYDKYIIINKYIFIFIIITFFVKVPLYSLHGWLLKAHVEAPVYGSILLASILLKLGTYGLLQILIIFINLFNELRVELIVFRIVGRCILRIVCLRQVDIKIVVAYSSVVHIGILIVGMLTISSVGIVGAIIIIAAHGLCSSGLFYLVNLNYKQTNRRIIILNKGILNLIPKISIIWFLFCCSNIAAPVSLNLIGELFLIIRILEWLLLRGVLLGFICFIRFCYSLNLFSYVQHGKFNYYIKIKRLGLIDYFILWIHWVPLNAVFFRLEYFNFYYLNSLIKIMNCDFIDIS